MCWAWRPRWKRQWLIWRRAAPEARFVIFVFQLSLHTSIILEKDDHNIQALSKDNHKLRCLSLGWDQPCSYSWLWLVHLQCRHGTSSQYQNSYFDLAVWYCICPLNQNINKYWNGNATYPKSMFFIMWSSGWRVLWNDFLNTCDAIAIVLLWMSCPAFNSSPLFSEKFLEHRFLFKAIIFCKNTISRCDQNIKLDEGFCSADQPSHPLKSCIVICTQPFRAPAESLRVMMIVMLQLMMMMMMMIWLYWLLKRPSCGIWGSTLTTTHQPLGNSHSKKHSSVQFFAPQWEAKNCNVI